VPSPRHLYTRLVPILPVCGVALRGGDDVPLVGSSGEDTLDEVHLGETQRGPIRYDLSQWAYTPSSSSALFSVPSLDG
jgi:hypothetical protein